MLRSLSLEVLIVSVPALLFAISVHEFSHGFMSFKLGDPTPKYQGRLTLNPLAHLDPIGALMLLFFRFGWAKPVLVNPNYYRNPRQGMMLVAAAGPASNVFLAWAAYMMLGLLYRFAGFVPEALFWATQEFLTISVFMNLGLAAFNLLPIPPLDGSKILAGVLPVRYAHVMGQVSAFAPILLIVLLVSGTAGVILHPIMNFLLLVITGFGLW